MLTPVDISADGPIRFKMSDGSVESHPNYVILEGSDGLTINYRHGCVRGELRFTAHATLGAIYAAIVENERKFRR